MLCFTVLVSVYQGSLALSLGSTWHNKTSHPIAVKRGTGDGGGEATSWVSPHEHSHNCCIESLAAELKALLGLVSNPHSSFAL